MSHKILIADDDHDFVETLSARLEASGYDIVRAYEGIRALQMAHAERPDLIILDWKMPAGKGSDVLKDLKKAPETKHIPVIVATGISGQEIKAEAERLGADAFFVKPFNNNEMLVAIKELLATRKR